MNKDGILGVSFLESCLDYLPGFFLFRNEILDKVNYKLLVKMHIFTRFLGSKFSVAKDLVKIHVFSKVFLA